MDNFSYRSLLGALLYLSMNTRPDMSYAVGLLSRFGSHPTVATCKLMVHALQYLRGTVHMGIRYSGSMFDLHVFTDADWAGDVITRRSTTNLLIFNMVADSKNSETLKSVPKFDGKDPEQTDKRLAYG